ncbi:MAG: hypothetical protein RLZZ210_320 [Pseudomonadota bacterium]|jgi:flavin reductase (DIM6/NTAB) family NADH-FMN oxidoreductase RutF
MDTTEIDLTSAYKNALSSFLTGIALVTCADNKKNPFGITINSFNSVSLIPRIVCWSIGNHNKYARCFSSSKYLIQILNSSHKDVAKQFSKTSLSQDFDDKLFSIHSGSSLPLLNDCLAWFECSLHSSHDVGDHVLLLSNVINFKDNSNGIMNSNIDNQNDKNSLAFFRRDIFSLNDNT